VAADQPGGPPALEHEVEVGAADPAVAHLHQDLTVARRRDRPLLHRHLARRAVDGDGHDRGKGGHGASPIISATRARWAAPEPNIAAVVFTRFTYMCISCSQV